MKLRYYQQEAVDALFTHDYRGAGNPLIVLPTGTGKSICIAAFCERALKKFPKTRIIIATHSRELVKQNYLELMALWPFAPAGIYSAGLKRRDTDTPILFCGIQSAYDKAYDFQRCDLLLIDEAHTVGREAQTMWGKFIADLKVINPNLRVIGLSATPYRMDSGSLVSGDGRLFDCIVYEYELLRAIKDGFLCEIISKNMATALDVSGVGKRGGEFIAGQLEAAVNIDSVTKAAIDEVFQYGADRSTWLLFCSGVDHSEAVAAEIRSRGVSCEAVTGETPVEKRDDILNRFKSGELRAVTNNNVMTTGTNIPRIDLIAGLRPTGSAGLHVQMLGRGMRLFDGKKNCLYLDFAKNCFRHGPLDKIQPREPGKGGDGDAPVKVCPKCQGICFAGVRECQDCGFSFPEPELKISSRADTTPILSTQAVEITECGVLGVSYSRHEKKGKPPSMKVSYDTFSGTIREWVCVEHQGYARTKAEQWFYKRGGRAPRTVDAAIEMAQGLPMPTVLMVSPQRDNPKYKEIVSCSFEQIKQDEVSVITQEDVDNMIPF